MFAAFLAPRKDWELNCQAEKSRVPAKSFEFDFL